MNKIGSRMVVSRKMVVHMRIDATHEDFDIDHLDGTSVTDPGHMKEGE